MRIFIRKKEKKKEEKEKLENLEKKWLKKEGELAVDLYETQNYLILRSAIAGVKPEDIDISIEKDVLTIKGKRDEPNNQEKKSFFFQECYFGPFSREVILPVEVDNSRAKAEIVNGILMIKIPKLQREKKRKIEIKETKRNRKTDKQKESSLES